MCSTRLTQQQQFLQLLQLEELLGILRVVDLRWLVGLSDNGLVDGDGGHDSHGQEADQQSLWRRGMGMETPRLVSMRINPKIKEGTGIFFN